MDTSLLDRAITSRTRCVLPVHLFGQCVDMSAVAAVAEKHGLKVLEDCAQCHGAKQGGRMAGSMSHASAWSFYPTKILGTYGDGGMVVTSDESLAKHVKRLRMYGNEGTYYSVEHGYNSRLDELHAEILLRKLPRLNGYVARRRELAARYDTLLRRSGLRLPVTAANNSHAYYLYVVRHPERDKIMKALAKRDIVVNVSYPWPVHTMKGYEYLGWKSGDLPETEEAAKEIFSLPMYPTLSNEEQDFVCAALHEILQREL
jgi:aminotransferase EvaB